MSRSDRDQRGMKSFENRAGQARWMARQYNRRERRAATVDLRVGRDPQPIQPRRRARWDLW